ncbi:MAG: UbiA family prenyltransferase [Deltaproteobacteria bacterium]|nr:UbiA family prenyltransferase [Deltaproteobacteria bacterium]
MAKEYQEKGGAVWLATAAHHAMAAKVFNRFDFFTWFLATNEKVNLRSEAKARALVEWHGEGKFIYAGDSGADPPVWRVSGGAVVVGDERLAKTAKPIGGEVTVIKPVGTKRPTLGMIVKLAKPQNCLQNALVFVPLLMSLLYFAKNFGLAFLAFLGFSLFTAGGNVLGELYSLERDRRDPEKKNRILAAGRLDLSRGGLISLGLALAGLILFAFLGRISFILVIFVLILTYLNEHIFKKSPQAWCVCFAFINAFVLASGYPLINILASLWMILLAFFTTAALGGLEMLSKLVIKVNETAQSLNLIENKICIKSVRKMTVFILFNVLLICSLLLFFNVAGPLKELLTSKFVFNVTKHNIAFLFTNPKTLFLLIPIIFYFYIRLYFKASKGRITKPIFFFLVSDWVSWICLILVSMVFWASGTKIF